MDDLELQAPDHKPKGSGNRVSGSVPVRPQGQSSARLQAQPEPVTKIPQTKQAPVYDSPNDPPEASPLSQNLPKIIGGVLALVIVYFAYSYFTEDSGYGPAPEVGSNTSQKPTMNDDQKTKRLAEENEQKRLELQAKMEADKREKELKAIEAQEAAKRDYDAKQKAKRDEFEAKRKEAAVRKLSQLKNLLQSDLTKFETEMLKIDNEINAHQMTIATSAAEKNRERARLEAEFAKVDEAPSPDFEKARREAAAAKNQAEYANKKIDEANLQLQEYSRRPSAATAQLAANLRTKIEGLRKEASQFQAAAAKADGYVQTEQARRETEINRQKDEIRAKLSDLNKDVMTIRAKQLIKDLLSRRERVQKLMKDKVLELTQLRVDPDYVELSKLGADIDIQKTIDQTNALIASLPPKPPEAGAITTPATNPATTTPKPNAGTPGTPTPTTDPNVVVSTKKQKVTVYTLKDGKTIHATSSVDADDQISVKTLEGKFQSIFKEDIVKTEVKEE